jgi:hypothetical protein
MVGGDIWSAVSFTMIFVSGGLAYAALLKMQRGPYWARQMKEVQIPWNVSGRHDYKIVPGDGLSGTGIMIRVRPYIYHSEIEELVDLIEEEDRTVAEMERLRDLLGSCERNAAMVLVNGIGFSERTTRDMENLTRALNPETEVTEVEEPEPEPEPEPVHPGASKRRHGRQLDL